MGTASLLSLLAAAAWAGPLTDSLPGGCSEQGVDLAASIPFAERNQGDVGSCHAFATVALLEGAVARSGAGALDLSEADVFGQAVIEDGSVFRNASFGPSSPGIKGWMNPSAAVLEGGIAQKNIARALASGVAGESAWTYDELNRNYAHAARPALERQVKLAGFDAAKAGKDYSRPFADYPQPDPANAVKDILGVNADQRYQRIMFEREKSRQAFAQAGLKAESRSYKAWNGAAQPAAGAPAAPLPQHRDILASLCAGVPVGVSMRLDGLKEWGSPPAGSGHAFLIVGFKPAGDEAVFLTRNSWGPGKSPTVAWGQIERIRRIDRVLAGSELPFP